MPVDAGLALKVVEREEDDGDEENEEEYSDLVCPLIGRKTATSHDIADSVNALYS
jgi:hypothetical protein